jgi:hypothetical protein
LSGTLTRARSVALAIATCVAVSVLGAFDGCAMVTDRFTGGGETVRMQPTRLDPNECDVLHGEALLQTLSGLQAPAYPRRRVLFIGNSQQYTASLPRGATPDMNRQADIAAGLLGQWLEQRRPGGFAVYTAAAPNQNFAEALWQGIYWFKVQPRPPEVLVLQASFDTFRKTGIRSGFLTLLDDSSFKQALAEFAAHHPSRAWAGEFAQARKKHDETTSTDDLAADTPPVEAKLRKALEAVPLFSQRADRRSHFLTMLYMARVHALGISPTTKRHITGEPLEVNFHALEDLIDMAVESGTTVLVYNAPVNPQISMFFEEEYAEYLHRLEALASNRGARLADLGDAVETAHWGYWIDGPDPIHFDEAGHAQLASRLADSFGSVLLDKTMR